MCANVCSQNKQASVHEHGCHAMCGHACLHTCTPCVLSSVWFTLHLLCFPMIYRAPACLITGLPSTCLPFPLAYQAPAGLLPRFTKHLPCFSNVYSAPAGFSQACQASAWLLPQVYQAHAWLRPRFTMHLQYFSRFTKHLLCCFLRFTEHLLPFCWVYH